MTRPLRMCASMNSTHTDRNIDAGSRSWMGCSVLQEPCVSTLFVVTLRLKQGVPTLLFFTSWHPKRHILCIRWTQTHSEKLKSTIDELMVRWLQGVLCIVRSGSHLPTGSRPHSGIRIQGPSFYHQV